MFQFLDWDGKPWFHLFILTFNQDEIGEVIFWMELDGEFLNFGSIEGYRFFVLLFQEE